MNYNELNQEEKRVIINKGTELPFTGIYHDHKEKGIYVCRQCNYPLYKSENKFDSGCGLPSFDDEIEGSVTRKTDKDGHRTEILCSKCGGHLGHVFLGEGFTEKDTRHCVNSVSMDFIPESNLDTAVFAGGCFWGVEHYFSKESGVLFTAPGYTGGIIENPTYQQVCEGKTGHAEAVEIVFDKTKTDYEKLARLFFEIHDPEQINRQGPDVGNQYRSEIFYMNDGQKIISKKLIEELKTKGYKPVTDLTMATEFYKAEKYHQDYYSKTGGVPYCHGYTKRF
jgi:peptide methionine sulfoxide reductase msrA/msrB